MGLWGQLRSVWINISLEPVFFLFCINWGLISISTQELYLDKACIVNLNYSRTICKNIYNYTEIQQESQRYVSEIQAYNGILQSAPAIVFTLFAGPMTDRFGRKFLIICSLIGYLTLNIVLLINSIWFDQLKVEWLLLECLQDFTGGGICFYLACYSYMVDITTPDTRTKRMSILDAAMSVGLICGTPLGTYIKNNYGLISLFSSGTGIMVVTIIYVFLVVNEKKKKREMEEDIQEEENIKLECNKNLLSDLWRLITTGLTTIFRSRPYGARTWVVTFILIFCLSKSIDKGTSGLTFMFARFQYKIDNSMMSTLSTYYLVLMFVCQAVVIPFMSGYLKLHDTSILGLAVLFNIIANIIIAFNSQIWVLYVSYLLLTLHNTISTTSRSNLSKLVESNEIGTVFSVVGILQALLPIFVKPSFSILYKYTVSVFPAAYILVAAYLYSIVLMMILMTHVGLKKMEKCRDNEDKEELRRLN